MTSQEWEAGASVSLLDSTTGIATNMANNAASTVGTEYDNTPAGTNNFTMAVFEGLFTFNTSFTVDTSLELYAIPAPDGTNYPDTFITGAGGKASPAWFLGAFSLSKASTTTARTSIGGNPNDPILLPPFKFKLLLINRSGVQLNTGANTWVKMFPYRMQNV